MLPRPPRSTLFPSRRSSDLIRNGHAGADAQLRRVLREMRGSAGRSEEHTSELQSHLNLVCRLLLEKKNKKRQTDWTIAAKATLGRGQCGIATLHEPAIPIHY